MAKRFPREFLGPRRFSRPQADLGQLLLHRASFGMVGSSVKGELEQPNRLTGRGGAKLQRRGPKT